MSSIFDVAQLLPPFPLESAPPPDPGDVVLLASGRRRIGVDQPQGGSQYPLLRPSTDIQDLLADFYLAYSDDTSRFSLPFHIAWLHGFGEDSSTPPDGAVAAHDYDIWVVDDAGRLVFDSTQATSFVTKDWDTRLRIVQWESADAVCRLVYFLGWDPDNTPRTYDLDLIPQQAELDSRTLELMPRRVRSLRLAGHEKFSQGVVRLRNGYSTTLELPTTTATPGGRANTTVLVGAQGGSGLGRYPGCSDIKQITHIDGVGPDAHGNFLLAAAECLRVEQRPHQVVLYDNCTPCYECEDFGNVYEILRSLWDKMVQVGHAAEAARDQYMANRTRWLEAGRERQSLPLRLAISSASGCRTSVTGAFCNTGNEILSNLVLKFHFVYSNPLYPELAAATPLTGTPICGTGTRVGNFRQDATHLAGRFSSNAAELYQMQGSWPTYTAQFDAVRGSKMAMVNFLMVIPGCDGSQPVEMVLEAVDGNTGNPVTYRPDWPTNVAARLPVKPLRVQSTLFFKDPCSE